MVPWIQQILNPHFPGMGENSPTFRAMPFLLMALIPAPFAITRYLFGLLDQPSDQIWTVSAGLALCLAIFFFFYGMDGLRNVRRQTWTLLFWGYAAYLAFWYFGRSNTFNTWVLPMWGWGPRDAPMASFAFFCLNNFLFLCVPVWGAAWFIYGKTPLQWGLSTAHNPHTPAVKRLWPIYLAGFSVVLPFVVQAAQSPLFATRYPLYDRVIGSDNAITWQTLLLCEALYIAQFVFLEAFFRGYMLFSLERDFGSYCLPLMCIPYVACHYGKPLPEVLGAIIAGTLLGWLALKHRSVLLGAAVHIGVALTMDGIALWVRATTITI